MGPKTRLILIFFFFTINIAFEHHLRASPSSITFEYRLRASLSSITMNIAESLLHATLKGSNGSLFYMTSSLIPGKINLQIYMLMRPTS